MKKLLALTLSLASIGFVASSAEAKASGASNSVAATNATAAPATVQWGRNNRRANRRVRTVTQSRLVRVGRRVFRETYKSRMADANPDETIRASEFVNPGERNKSR